MSLWASKQHWTHYNSLGLLSPRCQINPVAIPSVHGYSNICESIFQEFPELTLFIISQEC